MGDDRGSPGRRAGHTSTPDDRLARRPMSPAVPVLRRGTDAGAAATTSDQERRGRMHGDYWRMFG